MVFKVLGRDCDFVENIMNCGAGVMSESKDLGIKLFGRKIPVPEIQIPAESISCANNLETEKVRDDTSTVRLGGKGQQTAMHGESVNVKDNPMEDNADNQLAEQEKVLKKPDKILPCPRCHSLDTKFCYFNNYNVNQPRHFCKNCQRYWTAGGTMRNVPIGAGRRKNKHLTSQYRLATLSGNGLPETRIESADPANHHFQPSGEFSSTLRPSTSGGTVLKFGPETSLSNSVETVLNLKDQAGSASGAESREDASSFESSVTVSNVQENILPLYTSQNGHVGSSGTHNIENPTLPLPFYPVPAWYLPWNPAWRSSTSFGNNQYPPDRASISNIPNPTSVPWCQAPMLAVPNVCPPSIPLHVLSASYLGGMPLCAPRPADMSTALTGPSSPSSSTSNSSASTSLALGKHFRDASIDGDKSETCVLVPKTLRIDDPNEAAKSPLWTALGINPDKKDPCCKVGFESKGEGNGCLSEGNGIMEANPAALSRSQTFQESS